MTDIDILRRAYEFEHDTRRPQGKRSWEGYQSGASRSDLNRLKDEGLITIVTRAKGSLTASGMTKYLLTEKGRNLAIPSVLDREFAKVPVHDILEAMSFIVGFDDVKETLAKAISAQRRINFMLEGPPACAKSLILEGISMAMPSEYVYMAFGSRTTAAGLSQVLFEHQPRLLLLDEADKFKHQDVFSVLLGLMARGEIKETQHQNLRGITLDTAVIAACNSSDGMSEEFKSRFALHVHFPAYTREEFINVCRGFLTRAEGCPEDLAVLIGQRVFDGDLGDIRKALGVWQLVDAPTVEEVDRVVTMNKKYGKQNIIPRKRQSQKTRLPGL